MGANQSMPPGYRGGVKLRRRSSTAGVTSEELLSAGVDITRAVQQNAMIEQRRAEMAAQGKPSTGHGSPSYGTVTGGAAGGVAVPASAPPPAVAHTPSAAPSAVPAPAPAQPRKPTPATIELPPWEIVANLSDTDWFAIRGWLDNGWKCRKCGHIRDDHGDHPKAVRLLSACGVVPPQLRQAGGDIKAPSPSASTRSGTGPPGAVEYASTSPDHQMGYLSDSSPSSSLQSSPMHPHGRVKIHSRAQESSPRFRSECQGGGSPFDSSKNNGVQGVEACPHLAAIAKGGEGSQSSSGREGLPPRTVSGTMDSVGGGSTAGSGPMAPVGGGKWDTLRLKVLHAITRAQQVYFIDKEPNGSLVFDFLLSALLDCTGAGFGFISSALLKADGTPYLKTHAMSNVAWTKELRAWYAANAHKGLVFTNMNTLHGSIVLTGQPVITNDPSSDPRAHGVPPGHPPLESFMGVPLYTGTELIGIYGLANRGGEGFSEALMKELEPLTFTVAQMIYAVNERKRRKEAELHLASVVQVAKEGICSLSHSGHITSMNLSARVMFGFARDGDRKADEVPPPANLQFQNVVIEIDGRPDYLQHGLEQHSGNVHTGKGRRADGTIFPLEVSISRGTYDTVFFVAVLRDMSEKMETEAKLQESEDRWQYQVSGIDDGVWDWNLTHNTFFFSAKWFQNLGYGPAELPAAIETWDNLLHPDDKEAAYADLKDHLDGLTESYTNEHRLKCKDGTYKWFAHRGRVVSRSEEGEPVHFVGTHSDISDKRKFQDASTIAKEATHHLIRLEAEYLARAGVDVYKPAVQILESTGELQKTELGEKQKEHVNTIEDCGKRLVSVVKEQLDCGDIDKGKVQLEYHIFAVSEVVETAVRIMADRASAKGLETVIEMAADTPLFIVSDANRCMEFVINLLAAAKAVTHKGYIRVRLGAEMVFPHHDDEDADGIDDSHSVKSSEEGSEDVLNGEGENNLQGPQLHLVITIDSTGTSQGGIASQNSLAIQTASKLLPLLGGTLGTMIDPKRGAIYTAKIPVNSHHPEYKGAMAMRAAKPLVIRDPLLHMRVLVVGPTQVTMAAVGKQLNAWQIPHSIASTSVENAFLKLWAEGKLPKVVASSGDKDLTKKSDGTPKAGVASQYDLVILDLSARSNIKDDENLQKVATMLGKDNVGVIVLTKTQWRESRTTLDGPNEDVLAMFSASPGGFWTKRKPVVLHKPMVRPLSLLAALEGALVSIPGNEGLLPQKQSGEDLLLLHGFLQKSAAKKQKRKLHPAVGSKFKGRVLMMEHNEINIHAAELLVSSKGGIHMDSAKTLAEAMSLLERQPYDIVFLDCHLPDMDDVLGTVRNIRAMDGQAGEIIATKQQLQKHEQDQLLAAGVTECISRPLTSAKLEQFFKEHLIEVKQ